MEQMGWVILRLPLKGKLKNWALPQGLLTVESLPHWCTDDWNPCQVLWAPAGPLGFPCGRQIGRALPRGDKRPQAPHKTRTHVHSGQDKSPGVLYQAASFLADHLPQADCGLWSLH